MLPNSIRPITGGLVDSHLSRRRAVWNGALRPLGQLASGAIIFSTQASMSVGAPAQLVTDLDVL